MTRKIVIFSLCLILLIGFSFCISNSYSADWSQYESGRNNVYVEGYDGQPGYVGFGDGSGTQGAIIWFDPARGMVFACYSALTASRFDVEQGLRLSSYTGTNDTI